jgi:phosphoribosylformimino-5-aminoimidazole carboxamide ribotide isomerase
MQVIPAIDLYGGRCVRLREGKFSLRTDYGTDPCDFARKFADAGAARLHVVDLEGARAGRVMNWPTIARLASLDVALVQAGGGIRTEEDVARLLDAGVDRVVVGSVALQSPETVKGWAERFGAWKFCVAVDVKDGDLASNGWQTTGGATLAEVVTAMSGLGIRRFLSTDIRRDGTLSGPNVPLYQGLVKDYPAVEWLASGGVRSQEDVRELSSAGVAGVVIGKALLEGTLRVEELLEPPC